MGKIDFKNDTYELDDIEFIKKLLSEMGREIKDKVSKESVEEMDEGGE